MIRVLFSTTCLGHAFQIEFGRVYRRIDLLIFQDLAGYINEVKRDNENMQLISDVEHRFSDFLIAFLHQHMYERIINQCQYQLLPSVLVSVGNIHFVRCGLFCYFVKKTGV